MHWILCKATMTKSFTLTETEAQFCLLSQSQRFQWVYDNFDLKRFCFIILTAEGDHLSFLLIPYT